MLLFAALPRLEIRAPQLAWIAEIKRVVLMTSTLFMLPAWARANGAIR
jgi:hypothetical protein